MRLHVIEKMISHEYENVCAMQSAKEILEQLCDAKREVQRLECEYKLAQERCSHMYHRSRESDGHKTQTIYTCVKCYFITFYTPDKESCIQEE